MTTLLNLIKQQRLTVWRTHANIRKPYVYEMKRVERTKNTLAHKQKRCNQFLFYCSICQSFCLSQKKQRN